MLQVGLVCGFPRQTPACPPASPSPPKFPAHVSEQGSGHWRKVRNSLSNFVGSVKRSDVGRRFCFHKESLGENKTKPTSPPVPGPHSVSGWGQGCWLIKCAGAGEPSPVVSTTSPPALWDGYNLCPHFHCRTDPGSPYSSGCRSASFAARCLASQLHASTLAHNLAPCLSSFLFLYHRKQHL